MKNKIKTIIFNFIIFSVFLTPKIYAVVDENFIKAVAEEDIGLLKKLIGDGANPNSTNIYGNSALIIAVSRHSPVVVEYLLTLEGIDANLVSNTGSSALIIATKRGNDELVKLLIPYSNLELQDNIGKEAVDYAYAGKMIRIRKMIQDEQKRRSGEERIVIETADENFIKAIVKNDIGLIKKFIGDGANPNSTAIYGVSALIVAMMFGHDSVVKYLLTLEDIDVDSVSQTGGSALIIATQRGNKELVKLLIPHSNLELKDNTGREALNYAKKDSPIYKMIEEEKRRRRR